MMFVCPKKAVVVDPAVRNKIAQKNHCAPIIYAAQNVVAQNCILMQGISAVETKW